MPLVRISVMKGRSPEERQAISEAIHRAMVETIDVPPLDRFQLLTEHEHDGLVYDPAYLGIARSARLVVVQITLSRGRSLEQKRALYRRIAANLNESTGLRPQDVLVSLVEVGREDWSFGNGIASYAPETAKPEAVPI
jgi:phenylpyruvate tautomerase PptA (4-oxalocrotonate tautomerase family)